MPEAWLGIVPPIAVCLSCGATKKDNSPVIPMERPKHGHPHNISLRDLETINAAFDLVRPYRV